MVNTMVNTNRLMIVNDCQRLQLFFAWLLSLYYPNFQSFTHIQFRNLLTINAKRKPSSDFLFDLKAEEEGSGNYPLIKPNKSLEVTQLGL